VELPFRVLVAAVVVGLTVPTALTGLSAYESQQLSIRAMQAVESIVRVAQQFYVSGGGVEDVRVDLGGGVTARIEHVAVGDEVHGSLATTARFQISGQPEAFLLTDPPVPMAGEGGPLRLGPGRHVVRVLFEGDGPVHLAVVS
jgi:hypothetical protein